MVAKLGISAKGGRMGARGMDGVCRHCQDSAQVKRAVVVKDQAHLVWPVELRQLVRSEERVGPCAAI